MRVGGTGIWCRARTREGICDEAPEEDLVPTRAGEAAAASRMEMSSHGAPQFDCRTLQLYDRYFVVWHLHLLYLGATCYGSVNLMNAVPVLG